MKRLIVFICSFLYRLKKSCAETLLEGNNCKNGRRAGFFTYLKKAGLGLSWSLNWDWNLWALFQPRTNMDRKRKSVCWKIYIYCKWGVYLF